MSSGMGVSGKMVVCGSCMFDASHIRFGHSAMVQDKDPIVSSTLLKRMIKVSFAGSSGVTGYWALSKLSSLAKQ